MFTRREILRSAGLGGPGLAAPSFLNGCGADGATGFWSPTYAATILDARIAIAQGMADTQTPSISVALCDGEGIIWRETFGYIDQARSVPPGLDTLYCIGSCSKMIAAIAAMILVDRGLIDLDAPLVRYVADFRMESPDYSAITVRMLLSHAAGLPGTDYHNLFTFAPVLDYAAQVRHNLAAQRLKHPPGEMAAYCNDGFTLIEPLVDATTGRSYPRFVQDEILTPLGPEVPPLMPASDATLAAMAGIYANHSSLLRFAINPDRTLSRATFHAGAWHPDPTPWRLHGDGLWRTEGQAYPAYHTVPADGRRYLAQLVPGASTHYDLTVIDGHDLEAGGELSPRWLARLAERWLLVNAPVDFNRADGSTAPVCTLSRVEGLGGYVAIAPAFPMAQVVDVRASDTRGSMCLKIPGNSGRDLNDLVIEAVADEEWLRFGSFRYRPLASIPELGAGEHLITLAEAEVGEWRRLPAAATLTIAGASAWYLDDPHFALLACLIAGKTLRGLEEPVPAGAYLLVHGSPFTTIQVIVGQV